MSSKVCTYVFKEKYDIITNYFEFLQKAEVSLKNAPMLGIF